MKVIQSQELQCHDGINSLQKGWRELTQDFCLFVYRLSAMWKHIAGSLTFGYLRTARLYYKWGMVFIRETSTVICNQISNSQSVGNKLLLFVYHSSTDIMLWRQIGTKAEITVEERRLDVKMKVHFSTGKQDDARRICKRTPEKSYNAINQILKKGNLVRV